MAARYELPTDGSSKVGVRQFVIARYEDTFADLAERYNLGYQEMLDANPGVDAWLPKVGTTLQIPTEFKLPDGAREGVVIDLTGLRLYYFPAGTRTVYTYPVGIGREGWSSPLGTTRITEKVANPSWFPTPSIRAEHAAEGDPLPSRVPPGPDNPLGPYKIRLGQSTYLIHGSNKKFGIGTRTSHGCFRMYNHDIEEFFSKVPAGTKVRIVGDGNAGKAGEVAGLDRS
ncbi:L,D-transpeptidase family protein [Pseudomonas sp. C1C7]|nr:L,D-transpeptidase family protein [Pseudomonas sp. C1C7]